ncbi:MAG: DUF4242 domain-containing protein [SAR202 cluster bacterium]|jgi:hypothetical protein|nr:DUF4242 domain-containing protein [SAR202 cluster bacterium]MDP6513324.1 DUF4242 domain-containing protein [SAR202 cluster bacterium]MDP6713402.1 DUF4242 domain-containing protein [SAR202 cluster bacterium]
MLPINYFAVIDSTTDLQEDSDMPFYMDVHRNVEGLTSEAVAGAHQRDLEIQNKHSVNFTKYWFNASEGTVFCLYEAPSGEQGQVAHQEAHGLVTEEVIEVTEGA